VRLFIEEIFRMPYKFFTNRNYRTYLKLLLLYGSKTRYIHTAISLFGKKIFVPDCRSFLPQFRDIYVEENYKFNTNSESPVIIDCGANLGLSTIYFSNLFPASKIFSFEPDAEIFKLLSKNISVFNKNNVELRNEAVWINDSEIQMSNDGADGGSLVYSNKSSIVKAIRLKEFLNNFKKIDMLKIDIEGAETEVILDCKDSLNNVNNLFIEYHSHQSENQQLSNILSVLESNNFRYFIKEGMKRELPFINTNKTYSGIDLMLNIYAIKKKPNETN